MNNPPAKRPSKSGTGIATSSNGKAVQVPFQWRMSGGLGYISVKLMATRHLFNTLRMIWNLTMPDDAVIGGLRFSRFGPEYTEQYLKQALVHIYTEMLGRDNVTPAMLNDLQKMRDYLAKNRYNLLDNTAKITRDKQ